MKKEMILCPSNDIFERAFLGQMNDEEREAFVDHVFACHKCRIKFEALESLGRQLKNKEGEFAGEGLTMAERRALRKMGKQRLREVKGRKSVLDFFPPLRTRPLILMASGFVLLILVGFLLFQPFARKNIFRDITGEQIRLIEPKGIIKNPPTQFVWIPYKGTDIYTFKLIDEDLQTIVYKDTLKASFTLDSSTQGKLERGKKYIWSVQAWSDDEIQLAIAREYFIVKLPGS